MGTIPFSFPSFFPSLSFHFFSIFFKNRENPLLLTIIPTVDLTHNRSSLAVCFSRCFAHMSSLCECSIYTPPILACTRLLSSRASLHSLSLCAMWCGQATLAQSRCRRPHRELMCAKQCEKRSHNELACATRATCATPRHKTNNLRTRDHIAKNPLAGSLTVHAEPSTDMPPKKREGNLERDVHHAMTGAITSHRKKRQPGASLQRNTQNSSNSLFASSDRHTQKKNDLPADASQAVTDVLIARASKGGTGGRAGQNAARGKKAKEHSMPLAQKSAIKPAKPLIKASFMSSCGVHKSAFKKGPIDDVVLEVVEESPEELK